MILCIRMTRNTGICMQFKLKKIQNTINVDSNMDLKLYTNKTADQ